MRFVKTVENLFGLPQGFTRVEYLESSGTQYIDTGFKVDDTCGYDIKWMALNANDRIVLGTKGSGDSRWVLSGSNNLNVNLSWNTSYGSNGLGLNKIQTAQMNYLNDRKRFLNGIEVTPITGTLNSGAGTYNVCIFCGYWGATTVSLYSVCRLYYAKMTKGNTVVRDYIPCLDPFGVPCLYDLVGKKAYYNQGTGTFTAGRQVIPVEYLESTGTQYIDTGVGGDLTTELTCEAAIVHAGNSSVTNIMGNNVTSSRAITINMSANVTNPSVSRIRFGNTDNTTVAGAINLNTFYKYDTNKNELTVRDSSGTVLNTYPLNATTAFTTNGNILIYKLGDTSTQYIGKIKVKSATIKTNGVFVRDFIPCKDENNVGFMFDKISGTVYLNAGTGAFGVGENKYKTKLRLIREVGSVPVGCTEVEYLESTGTQYIDTGIKGKNNLDFDYKAVFTNVTTSSGYGIGGEWQSGNSLYLGVIRSNGTFAYHYRNTTSPVVVLNSVSANTPYVIQGHMWTGEQYMVINGTKSSVGTLSGTFTSNENIALFRVSSSTPIYSYTKIYYLKIWDNGVLVRDMIPVLDWNMTPCMYDKVSGQLFYNQGTGNFTSGREIHQVEYIETDGTSYINTGYTPSGSTETEITTMLKDQTYSRFMFGCRSAQKNNTYACLANTSNRIGYRVGQDIYLYSSGYNELNVKHTYKIANGVFYRDDVVVDATCQGATTSPNSPLALLTINTNNALERGQTFVGNFYSCTVKENNVLVRDYIPAKDENGVGFMFDRVSHTIYDNAGTGAFLTGRPKCKLRFVQDVVPREYAVVNYIEATGTQWIDIGIKGNFETKIEAKVYSAKISTDSGYGIAGDLTTSTKAITMPFNFTNSGLYSRFGDKAITGGIQQQDGTYTFAVDKDGYYVDGIKIANFNTTTAFTTTNTIMLFGFTGLGRNYLVGKMYYCKIWDGGVIVRNFIPVVRRIDKVAGMWDTVTKQFFTTPVGAFNYG